MRDVLEEAPKKHSAEKSSQDARDGKTVIRTGQIQHIPHDGDVHSPNDERMRFGQHFQKIILKQASLTFIVDFFELHGAKIPKRRFLRKQSG